MRCSAQPLIFSARPNRALQGARGRLRAVVGNTMAMAVCERTREIGVLKTLGFAGGRILRLVLGESVPLALIGGLCGIGLAALFVMVLREFVRGIAVAPLTPGIALTGFAPMLGLGVVTGLIPALTAMRLNIAAALGRS